MKKDTLTTTATTSWSVSRPRISLPLHLIGPHPELGSSSLASVFRLLPTLSSPSQWPEGTWQCPSQVTPLLCSRTLHSSHLSGNTPTPPAALTSLRHLPCHLSSLTSFCSSLAHSAAVFLVQNTRHRLTSGPLHGLLPQPGVFLPPDDLMVPSFLPSMFWLNFLTPPSSPNVTPTILNTPPLNIVEYTYLPCLLSGPHQTVRSGGRDFGPSVSLQC